MITEVGSYLKITDPSPAIMDWCKENLVLPNPEYQKKVRMHLWVGNTPKQLLLYGTNGNDPGKLRPVFGSFSTLFDGISSE